jgi:hypothetical protein
MQPLAGGIGLIDFDSDYGVREEQALPSDWLSLESLLPQAGRTCNGRWILQAYEGSQEFHAT